MASTTQQTLYDSFAALAGGAAIDRAIEETTARLDGLNVASQSAPAALLSVMSNATGGGLTPSVLDTVAQQTGSQGKGAGVLSTVSQIFTSGLGLVPLIGGLLGLFGGGGNDPPPPLVKYALPDPIYFQGANIATDISPADYDQFGTPRVYGTAPAAPTAGSGTGTAPQITVNVQAMDSRSFLDHSSEIAEAVRQAMLNLNAINDVVSDL